jgi:hypothetical protein
MLMRPNDYPFSTAASVGNALTGMARGFQTDVDVDDDRDHIVPTVPTVPRNHKKTKA